MNDKEKENFLARGGDPRWFDVFELSGEDICALVQAGSSPSMLGTIIFDHPDVEKILKGKRTK